MTTAPNYNYTKKIYEHMVFPIATTTAVNTGDCVYIASYAALPCSTDANATYFAGVSNDTNPVVSLGDTLTKIRVNRHGVFEFNGTSGDTYHTGDAIYLNSTDAQTVTNQAGSHTIGVCVLNDGVTSLAYSSGAKVPVAIAPAYMSAV